MGQAIVFRGLPSSSGAQTTNNDRLRHAGYPNEIREDRILGSRSATDPVLFRPMTIPSVLEKVSYTGALLVLYLQDRISAVQAATAIPDLLLPVLFVAAYCVTPGSQWAQTQRPGEPSRESAG